MNAICRCQECEGQRSRRAFFARLTGVAHGRHDTVIIRARELLREYHVDPHLIPDLRNIALTSLAEDEMIGCVDRHNRIWIDPDSRFYRDAQAGDLLGLASLLLHEQHHVLHGADEHGAYRVELDFLRVHGASQNLLYYVEEAARANGCEVRRFREMT